MYVYVCTHVCVRLTDISDSNSSARLLPVNNHSQLFPTVFKRVTGKAETFLWFISVVSCCLYVRILLIWAVCLSSQWEIIILKQSNGTNTCPISSNVWFYNFIQIVFKNGVPTGHKANCICDTNNVLMFTEIVAVHCRIVWKAQTYCGQNAGTAAVKASCTLSSREHCAFNVWPSAIKVHKVITD